jgi:hypothetical protein
MEHSNSNSDVMNPEDVSKQYEPFMINRGLSFFPDTVFLANEMNLYPDLAGKMQYDFLCNTVRPMKRYSGKWPKQAEKDRIVSCLMERFSYSRDKAESVVDLLPEEERERMLNLSDTGGTK